ncbi:hypothetical protein [Actinacidiphila yeochonensis]|uniref:hypothetical protein n=1 Tax=Actinacidiphila yeochonensis TaxID=89050 RepID=UPI000564FA03|nr:hypothetical protein [Actinacidiphila yeochonensis]
MEFTRSRRLRTSGRRLVGWGLAVAAGAVVWAVAADGPARASANGVAVMAGLAVLNGIWTLRRARRPFTLRIDEHGIAVNEDALGWEQIDGVALRYSPMSQVDTDDHTNTPPPPRLFVYPADGAGLPGLREAAMYGRRAYDVVATGELDQGLDRLIETLTRHAGPRFEASPHGMRRAGAPEDAAVREAVGGRFADTPGVRGAVLPPGLPARTFEARRNTAARLLAALALAAVGAVLSTPLITGGPDLAPEPFSALAPLGAILGCFLSLWYLWLVLRPLRLRLGPDGLTARNFAGPLVELGWDQVVAVTVARKPGAVDKHLWLLVWLAPGHTLDLPHEIADGHRTYPLVEVRRLRDGGEVEAAARYFAGSRYVEPAP